MKQSHFRYLGVLDLLLVAAFVAAFGVGVLATTGPVAGMALAGVLALLAGSVAELAVGPMTVSWRHLVAGSYALFGLILPGSYLPAVVAGSATDAELGLFAATSVGGLTLLFYGYDVLRGGKHFEVTPDVDRTVGG